MSSALPPLAATMPVQEFFEETAEYEAGVHAGQRRRVAGLSRRKSLTVPKEQTFDVPGAVSCYCRCMQHMLQASTLAAMLPRESRINFCLSSQFAWLTASGKILVRALKSRPRMICLYARCHARLTSPQLFRAALSCPRASAGSDAEPHR